MTRKERAAVGDRLTPFVKAKLAALVGIVFRLPYGFQDLETSLVADLPVTTDQKKTLFLNSSYKYRALMVS